MADKQSTQPDTSKAAPLDAIAQLQEAGFKNISSLGTAWVEALSEMGAEMVGFVADRIKEDVKAQHEMLHCKDIGELQQLQGKFIQKAMDQYNAESGKLVEMSTKAFAPKTTGGKS